MCAGIRETTGPQMPPAGPFPSAGRSPARFKAAGFAERARAKRGGRTLQRRDQLQTGSRVQRLHVREARGAKLSVQSGIRDEMPGRHLLHERHLSAPGDCGSFLQRDRTLRQCPGLRLQELDVHGNPRSRGKSSVRAGLIRRLRQRALVHIVGVHTVARSRGGVWPRRRNGLPDPLLVQPGHVLVLPPDLCTQ
jgi:hypothetical protein